MTNNNWELVKLGDILNFKTGRLDSNAATLNGEYPGRVKLEVRHKPPN